MQIKIMQNVYDLTEIEKIVNTMENVLDVDIIRDFKTSISMRGADSAKPNGYTVIIKLKEIKQCQI